MKKTFFLQAGLVVLLAGLCLWAKGQNIYPLGGGVNREIRVLFPDTMTHRLLVGGSFVNVDGMPIQTSAMWNGMYWDSVDNRLAGGFCSDFAYYQNQLYGAGALSLPASGGVSAGYIDASLVIYRDSFWKRVADSTTRERIIYDMIAQDSSLWLLGLFDTIGGTPANLLARYDGQQFYGYPPLDTLEARLACGQFYGGSLYVGGNFDSQLRPDMKDIARWDSQQWQPVGAGMSGPFSWVNDMILFDSLLIVGGHFFQDQGDPANAVAAWDGQQWIQMGDGFNGQVYDFEIHNGELYAAGAFTHSGNRHVPSVARWDGSQWQKIANFVPAATAIASWDGSLYIGGNSALTANGQPMHGICRYGFATGIEALGPEPEQLQVWPNPTQGRLQVALPDFTAGKEGVLSVCDLLGREVLPRITLAPYEKEAALDVSALMKGVYLLSISSGGRVAVGKVARE